MSSKSNDIYSEIIEKSYSVKSVSLESLCLDDDEALAEELLHKMDAPVVSKLRRCFRRRQPDTRRDFTHDLDRKVSDAMRRAAEEEGIEFAEAPLIPKHKDLWADEQLFVSSLDKIFGSHKYTTHAQRLFRVLDPFSTRLVWWSDLLERLVRHGARRNRSRAELWSPVRGDLPVKELVHCKKETIVKVVSISQHNTFCYVVISKRGRVGAYDGTLNLLAEYDIFSRTGQHRRMKTTWITDAIYMNDTKCLLIAASDRSLTIYDASTLCHSPLYHITGIPNIPTCLTYEESQHKTDTSRLFFGDDHGSVTTIKLKQPRLCPLFKKYSDRINDYFWIELNTAPHDAYCGISTWRHLHARCVRRVYYCRRHDVVISCSNDADASVVVRHRPRKIGDYVFRVLRGVSCFHMSSSLRVLATGSSDGRIRLWDPALTMRPFAVMNSGTRNPIIDVAILAHLEIVLAFTKNVTVEIWDIYEESCLQKIRIKYPFLGILGKRVEFGTYCLYPGPKRGNCFEEPEVLVPSHASSPRGSHVLMEEGGALKLEKDEPSATDHYCFDSKADSDPEHVSWDKPEIMVACCGYVAVVRLVGRRDRGDTPPPLPPPPRLAAPRRPSVWDNAELVPVGQFIIDRPDNDPRREENENIPTVDIRLSTPQSLGGSQTTTDAPDLDTILEQAGLNGILEKDFTLMMGLKHDLNRKLAELGSKQEAMRWPVSQCAPHIALELHEPLDIRFSRPLHVSGRMARRCGRRTLCEPEEMRANNSCFNMSTPRSSVSVTPRPSSGASTLPSRT